MKLKLIAAAALATLLAAPVFAASETAPRANARQANQDARIDQGVASGSLTKREAARLEKGQQHVQNIENKALADGKVTKVEKLRIEKAQDVQSARIAKQKHDRQHDRNHDGKVDKKK
ncbi:MAG: hypothetical protein HYZ17_14620 [Betaproteobacteria bacterium]|nr:hypothetical protein [Betaproteobacteria bacterium]